MSLNRLRRTALLRSGRTQAQVDAVAPLMAPPPAWHGMPTTGNNRILALLVDFPDYPSLVTQAEIDSKLFGAGVPVQFPYESLTSYYARSSYNLLQLSGNTLGYYRTAYNRTTIAETTAGQEGLIKELLNHYNAQGHDFSQYDNDGDGVVDYFMVFWAGPAGTWASFWWGYQTGFSDATFVLDGVRFGRYSWQWDTNGATTFSPRTVIHETGHALGLPDLYDYDSSVGPRGGLGGLDMMDGNRGDHNCFSKLMLEWVTPTFVGEGTQALSLQPSGNSANNCVAIWPSILSGNPFSEFFAVQNRHRVGNDAVGMPGDGMLLFHVDATLNAAGTSFLYNNSYTAHKLIRVMEADGLEEIEAGGVGDAADYWSGPSIAFTESSLPSSDSYAGEDSFTRVHSFAAAGNPMSATYEIFESMPAGTIVAFGGDVGSIPNGWLLCNGQAVSRSTYSALFLAIGTAHGQGDGSTTFNLPDYRGYFLRGADMGAANDPNASTRTPMGPSPWTPQQVGSRQDGATRMPGIPFVIGMAGAHTHAYKDWDIRATTGTIVDTYDRGSNDSVYHIDTSRASTSAGDHSHGLTGGDQETRPKNKYVLYIIKT